VQFGLCLPGRGTVATRQNLRTLVQRVEVLPCIRSGWRFADAGFALKPVPVAPANLDRCPQATGYLTRCAFGRCLVSHWYEDEVTGAFAAR
jgi:hypothetical protein